MILALEREREREILIHLKKNKQTSKYTEKWANN